MNEEKDPIELIRSMLETKSTAKQITYKNLLDAFLVLSKEAARVADELIKKSKLKDEDITIEFVEINEHEFHVKLAGDLLVFVLHTNVVSLPPDHPVMNDPYFNEGEVNRYFGQIMIYNFMSDSFKFNRSNDPGYLLARLLINHEARYIMEGNGRLGALSNKISGGPISEIELNVLIKIALTMAIENDLVAPPFPQVQFITVHQKNERTQEMGSGQKIGFRMRFEDGVK
jgi:hypothetical protein